MSIALPDFMARLLGHAELVEKNLKAEAELEKATARIAELESEVAALKAASADGPVRITELTGQLSTLTANLSAKDAEILTLRADLATAKATANAVIASQGLPNAQLPALDPNQNPASVTNNLTGTLTEQCLKAKKAAKQ